MKEIKTEPQSPIRLRSPAKTPCPPTPRQSVDINRTPPSCTGSPMLWFTADIFNDFGHAPTPPKSASRARISFAAVEPRKSDTSPLSSTPDGADPKSSSMARRSLLDLKSPKGSGTPTEKVDEPGVVVIEESDVELEIVSKIAVTGSLDTDDSDVAIEPQVLKLKHPVIQLAHIEELSADSDVYLTPTEENNGQ